MEEIFSIILGAAIVYFFDVRKERRLKKIERKENQYKSILENITGFFDGHYLNEEKQKKFVEEVNSMATMYASTKIYKLLNNFMSSLVVPIKETSAEREKRLETSLNYYKKM